MSDDGRWLAFLDSKGFYELVEEIRQDVYIFKDGTVGECTDQQLKFEPYTSLHGEWDEDVYRLDVALWAEFILSHEQVLKAYQEFINEHD